MKYAPQIAILGMFFMDFAIYMVKHGEERPNYSIVSGSISLAITMALLYGGGFFDGLLAALR